MSATVHSEYISQPYSSSYCGCLLDPFVGIDSIYSVP